MTTNEAGVGGNGQQELTIMMVLLGIYTEMREERFSEVSDFRIVTSSAAK